MNVVEWRMLEEVDKKTANIAFSFSGQNDSFDSLIKNIKKVRLKKVSENNSHYSSDVGPLEIYHNKVYFDLKQQINLTIKNGNLQIIIGEFTFIIQGFENKSTNKQLKKLSISITYENLSPIMCVNPSETLELIVIKGIEMDKAIKISK